MNSAPPQDKENDFDRNGVPLVERVECPGLAAPACWPKRVRKTPEDHGSSPCHMQRTDPHARLLRKTPRTSPAHTHLLHKLHLLHGSEAMRASGAYGGLWHPELRGVFFSPIVPFNGGVQFFSPPGSYDHPITGYLFAPETPLLSNPSSPCPSQLPLPPPPIQPRTRRRRPPKP